MSPERFVKGESEHSLFQFNVRLTASVCQLSHHHDPKLARRLAFTRLCLPLEYPQGSPLHSVGRPSRTRDAKRATLVSWRELE
jgi:hypothetical protein